MATTLIIKDDGVDFPAGLVGGGLCGLCGGDDTEVKDSRPGAFGTIRRRRRCSACDHRWTTYEVDGAFFDIIDAHGTWRRFLTLTETQRALIHAIIAQFTNTPGAGSDSEAGAPGQTSDKDLPPIKPRHLAARPMKSPVRAGRLFRGDW